MKIYRNKSGKIVIDGEGAIVSRLECEDKTILPLIEVRHFEADISIDHQTTNDQEKRYNPGEIIEVNRESVYIGNGFFTQKNEPHYLRYFLAHLSRKVFSSSIIGL